MLIKLERFAMADNFTDAIAQSLRKNKVTFDQQSYVLNVDNRDGDKFSIDLSALKVGDEQYFNRSSQRTTTDFR
jgi:hypothetical protein